ncbi:hypothetical protein PHYPSEUDO_005675 [Phytophthora pseudosyringae]|uniref:Uncharacterized protein n=1 Tax=Phytophthora pseudosyringae TaxID=221518 RepID=A0A8T1VNZ7_9STRA|nr:hypothetical protein PHYPSEUDO_005675 [Phytophthora pseudosyringae]
MGKSTDRNANTEEEFFKLEQVLNQSAEDTSNCLKLLKKHLSEYDSRNGNHFVHTASSYMRSDMRTAKDTAMDLKHVAHEINKNHKPYKTEISSARNIRDATTKAMETLKVTARNYDKENGQRMGVKGTVDAAVGGHHEKGKDEKHGLFGEDDKHKKDEQRGGLFGKSDKDKESEGGFFGMNKDEGENKGGLFGKSDKEKESEGGFFGKNKDEGEKQGGLFGKSDKEKESEGGFFGKNKDEGEKQGGLFGKADKEKHEHRGGFLGGDDKNGGGITGSSETVETLVKKTLRDNFSLSALDHQIATAEKSLSPSLVERAKEKMHDVKDKIKGDKSDPAHEEQGLHHEGHKHTVTP